MLGTRQRVTIGLEQADEVIEVLSDAFLDYPVMTLVIGEGGKDYPERLRLLVEYFTMVRYYRGDLVLGIRDGDGRLLAAANLNRPHPLEVPEVMLEHRTRLWSRLGADAERRYASYGRACEPYAVTQPHYHLGMVGVRREAQGLGLGGAVLDWVHSISSNDPASSGVSLTTELEGNVAFYQKYGYGIVGCGTLSNGNPSWSFWRPDDPGYD